MTSPNDSPMSDVTDGSPRPSTSPSLSRTLGAVRALWKREILKFLRERSRLSGAILQPLVFWLLLGFGFRSTFTMPAGTPQEVSYMEYLFPGVLALILLFTAIFSTISIVNDRREGFLQAVLVAPISRTAVVMGTLLGSTTLALAEGALFLLIAPLVGLSITPAGLLVVAAAAVLMALGFTALGFLFAWRRESVRGFHAIMNLILFPLWILSGAFFPPEGAPQVLQWIIRLNPVTYGVSALRQGIYWPASAPAAGSGLGVSLGVLAITAAVLIGAAVYLVRRPLFGGAGS